MTVDAVASVVREYLHPGVHWLDLFCGSATIPVAALIPGVMYVGLDTDRKNLLNAARRLPEHKFVRQTLQRPLPDADLVTCFGKVTPDILAAIPSSGCGVAILRSSTGPEGWLKKTVVGNLSVFVPG